MRELCALHRAADLQPFQRACRGVVFDGQRHQREDRRHGDQPHADPAQQLVLRRGEDHQSEDDDPRGCGRGELHDGYQLRAQRQGGVAPGMLHGVPALVGGDGGRGGSVWAEADRNINTLVDYQYTRKFFAPNGENGRGADCYGAGGKDVVLRMPVGTIIRDTDTGEIVADLNVHGARQLLAAGGKGGLGNLHFKSSVNRAPRQFTPGEPGQYRSLELELKVLADVGLLGMPNAGKSTLITAVSNARPKIADYPFTTLHPHLGVVRVGPEQSFVLADVPGLIEGAAEGAGLGHLFLRHLSRTKVLLHVIDAAPLDDTVDPFEQAHALVAELEKYDPELAAKPRWVVLNKMDLVPEEERDALVEKFRSAFAREGEPVFAVSAATREGLTTLLNALAQKIDEDRRAERAFLDDERFDEERENAEPYDPAAH